MSESCQFFFSLRTLKIFEHRMPEYTKLEYIKVWFRYMPSRRSPTNCISKEIGFTHMRILEGVGTIIQLAGLMARLCKLVCCSLIDHHIQNIDINAPRFTELETRTISDMSIALMTQPVLSPPGPCTLYSCCI